MSKKSPSIIIAVLGVNSLKIKRLKSKDIKVQLGLSKDAKVRL